MSNQSEVGSFRLRGEFPYSPKTMLAPMEGLTNVAVRNCIAARGGLGVVCTEFIRISGTSLSPKILKKELHPSPDAALSVQLMGNNASLMADSAGKLAQAGADIVDINLGCPTAKALKGNVGAAMLRDFDLLRSVLSSMREKIPGLMSAKVRAGFDTADRSLEIARLVQECGVDFIAIHPRSRQDQYKGRADWRIIKAVCDELSIPVVGNGDILYVGDAVSMRAETGCHALMIGRGALRNPWIFRQIEEYESTGSFFLPNGSDVVSFVRDIADSLSSYFSVPHDRLLPRFKEIGRMLFRAWLGDKLIIKDFLRSQSYEEFITILQSSVGDSPDNLWDCGYAPSKREVLK